MKLHIENIMAIKSVDIDLDGITVIVGNNNTGKSTAGKVLWTMFRALRDINKRTYYERVNGCFRVIRTKSPMMLWDGTRPFRHTCLDYAEQLVDKKISVDSFINIIKQEYQGSKERDLFPPDWDEFKKRLQEILAIKEDELQKQVVFTYFKRGLGEQFFPLFKEHGKPSVKMTIKGKYLEVFFNNSLPEINLQLDLQNNAYYFASPSLLENTNSDRLSNSDNLFIEEKNNIVNSFKQDGVIVEDLLLRKKYESIEAQLARILEGKITYDRDIRDFCLESSKYTTPLSFANLSQGVKSMATLQAAFSRGAIGEKDVLILDEPEIHLHPEWQVKYADLIVQLQKAFNLTILLTSHSPDFVEAIRLCSKKYGLEKKLNGYISEIQPDSGAVTMKKISVDNWDTMFEKFAKSVDMLMDLRSSIEGEFDE